MESAVGHPLQQLLAICSLLLPQLLDRAGGAGQRVGAGLVQQPIQLAAHRFEQLPPHRRGEGIEGGAVDGHGGGVGRRQGPEGLLRLGVAASAAMPLPATTISPLFSPPSPRLKQHFSLNEPNPRPTALVYMGIFICALCKCICGIWQDWTRGYRCGSGHLNPHCCHGYFSTTTHSGIWKNK
jgi:hypothetical protein